MTAKKTGGSDAQNTRLSRGIAWLVVLLLAAVAAHAQGNPALAPKPARQEPGIADNSFLMEEAYNQEYGVVQHINSITRNWNTRDWRYTLTQEWPVNPAPRHQLSYTLQVLHAGDFPSSGAGLGDVAINYRYQVIGSGESRAAFAPRVSLLIPSGNSQRGRGTGGAGVQINLPLSVGVTPKLVTHWNAGTTLIPRVKNEQGDRASSRGYNLGLSFVWLLHPRFNALLETVFTSAEGVTGPSQTQWENSVLVNPGLRWAHNFKNGLQIVPGVAFPVEVGRAGRGQWGVLLYLSFEHPFKRGVR